MLYGLLVRHLHDEQQLAPFGVEGIIKPRNDWTYLIFWAGAGVTWGTLLPLVDALYTDGDSKGLANEVVGRTTGDAGEKATRSVGVFGADWTPIVRSVGVFVGIAFAIVRSLFSVLHSFLREVPLLTNSSLEKASLDLNITSVSYPGFG